MNFPLRRHAGLVIPCLAVLMIGAALAQTSDKPADLSPLADADLKTVTIQLERSACFGTCPAYTLSIHGDGRLEYNGKAHVKETGSRESRIELDKIRALLQIFDKAKFLEIAEDYSEEKCKGQVCTDFPTAIMKLTVRGVAHRVQHYYGCASAPKSLFDLESSIDKTANSKQWTGDVSKAGPFGTTCMRRN